MYSDPRPGGYKVEPAPVVADDPPYTQTSQPGILHPPTSFHDTRGPSLAQHNRVDSPRQPHISLPPPLTGSYLPHLQANNTPSTQSSHSYPASGPVLPSQGPSEQPYFPNQSGLYPSPHSRNHHPPEQDPMAVHAVNRQMYPPVGSYHTAQSHSPLQQSHPDLHGRAMYGQNFGFSHQMFAYPQYPITQQPAYVTHPSPQSYTTVSTSGSGILMSQQTPPTLHSPSSQGMPGSPRLKIEQPSMQRPLSNLAMAQHAPVGNQGPPTTGMSSSGSGPNTNAAPGPIPATTPLVVRQDQNGVQWIAFEYSRDRVKMEYTIRCDVESISIDDLTPEFKAANCVYPRACSGKEGYKGNRLHYESECNAVGWALADLNSVLREKRGLIQRAVDSWRNSNQDPRLRSRRVRRQAKINTRKAQLGQPGSQLQGSASIVTGSQTPTAMSAIPSRGPPLNVAAGQLHHHHSSSDGTGGEDVSARNEVSPSSYRHSSPIKHSLSSPAESRSYPPYPSSVSSDSHPPPRNSHEWIKEEEDDKNMIIIDGVPESKKRKFILVDDLVRGTRVRVHVELDTIKMDEMPDFHLRNNSVFPRSYYPRQMRSPSNSPGRQGNWDDGTSSECEDIPKDEACIHVSLLDGSQAELSVPRMSKGRRAKECALNELGYRMSWRQAKTFNERMLFMQKSLDAYRDKMRSVMVASGKDTSRTSASHFEIRTGKRKWGERRKSTQADSDTQSCC